MLEKTSEFLTISLQLPKPKKAGDKRKLIGTIARLCRTILRVKQKDFATQLNIDENRLWKIEHGQVEASFDEISKIARSASQNVEIFEIEP